MDEEGEEEGKERRTGGGGGGKQSKFKDLEGSDKCQKVKLERCGKVEDSGRRLEQKNKTEMQEKD